MAKTNAFALATAMTFFGAMAAAADTGVVVGDSLGVGVSMASHLRSFAKNSVSIRATGAIDQIERAPEGSTVFLSLGTNDAVGNVDGLANGIQRIVAAANKAKVHLVWMGPPCVFKPWDTNAKSLDAELKTALNGTSVTYVSMQNDPRLCDRSVRAKDGVHFSMTGYHAMWDKARKEAGFTATAADVDSAAKPSGEATPAGEEKPRVVKASVKKVAKATRKKKRTKRRHARAASADSAPASSPAAAAAPAAPSTPQ